MKPFMGVISNAVYDPLTRRVYGTATVYKGPAQEREIEIGRPMYTSTVIGIVDMDGFKLCETANSRYVLLP